MAASIRGHQGQFKVFQDGGQVNLIAITSVNITQDSSFLRSRYVGQAIPEGDQAMEGWSGSIELEVKDSQVDDFIDALTTANLNGIGVSSYTFVSTENYADGTTRSYVYFDCQWKMSKKQGGMNEKITKHLDFQCSGRLKL